MNHVVHFFRNMMGCLSESKFFNIGYLQEAQLGITKGHCGGLEPIALRSQFRELNSLIKRIPHHLSPLVKLQ